jgi:ribonuclease Z
MLKVIFLGTSGGIPTIERGMPSIAIRYDRELMLWDCGEGTQRQMMKYKVGYGSIDAIFISHPHLDHFLGVYGLLETLKLSSASPKPLHIFSPRIEFRDYDFLKTSYIKKGKLYSKKGFTVNAVPVKHCKSAFGFIFQEEEKIKFHEKKAHSLGLKGKLFQEIQKKGKVKTNEGIVKLEDVSWIKPGRKIVYSGDCTPDNTIIEAAKNADLLIHEGTFDSSLREEALERLHSTASDAATIAKKARVKKLIITHISPRYSDVALLLGEARKIFSDTRIAHDGMVVDIRS